MFRTSDMYGERPLGTALELSKPMKRIGTGGQRGDSINGFGRKTNELTIGDGSSTHRRRRGQPCRIMCINCMRCTHCGVIVKNQE